MQTEKELTPVSEEQLRRDEEMVQGAFQKLLDTYKASPHNGDTDLIIHAFNFAKDAHRNARRKSGEPYIMHPIAVAQIMCEEMGLGSTTSCNRAAQMDVEPSPISSHIICATAIGCIM